MYNAFKEGRIGMKFSLQTVKSKVRDAVSWLKRLKLKEKIVLAAVAATVVTCVALVIVLPNANGRDSDEDVFAIRYATETPNGAELPTGTPYVTTSPAPTPKVTVNPMLIQGTNSAYVSSLQDRLMELGYLDIDEPTQYFGSATATAIQLFQRQHDLTMDGMAGQKTLTLLFSDKAEKYVMEEGTTGIDVKNLQEQLKMLGYYVIEVDGFYGSYTKKAVRDFQSRNGLAVDGLAGELTIEKLYSPSAVPAAWVVQQETSRANIQRMVSCAYAQLGKPYILGACGPNAFDCSGLVYYCLREAGSNRGRYNAAGYASVTEWEMLNNIDNLHIGDLLFFYNNSYSRIGHVGIYVGNGMMIDASANHGCVVLRTCRSYYWRQHFAWGRRPW